MVAGTLIGMMFFERDKFEGKVSCCAHIGIVTIMYTGTLLTAACAFLIPLDVALCWQSPPFSWLRLLEHLAMSIISFLIGAPLTWVPLLLWFLSACTIVPPRSCMLVMNYRKHGNTVTLLITYTILVVPNYINSIVKPKSIIHNY